MEKIPQSYWDTVYSDWVPEYFKKNKRKKYEIGNGTQLLKNTRCKYTTLGL